jgi:iron complex outermembrane receptor protein
MYNQRQDEYYSPALTTLDLTAGFRPPESHFSFDILAKNVGNAISQDFASATVDPRFSAFYGAYAASPNRLRTVMMSISYKY